MPDPKKDTGKTPILPRLINLVDSLRTTNRRIQDTVARLNHSIGNIKPEPVPAATEAGKEIVGEFESLESALNCLAAEQELSLKDLEDFTIRTLGMIRPP